MAEGPDPNKAFANAALLIAAHGSPSSPGGRTATRRHAERLANLHIFAEVGAGFIAEKPFVADVLAQLTSPDVYVVPNLACEGFIAREKLPTALGMTDAVTTTTRITPNGPQRLHLCPPVGLDPAVPAIMAQRILSTLTAAGVEADTEILVVGHGSTKGSESFEQTARIASALPDFGVTLPIHTAYLEEAPFVKDWQSLSDAKTIVVAPHLISDGIHGAVDIPLALGFNPGEPQFQETLARGGLNETTSAGRRILYMTPVGDAPEMVEAILNCVSQVHNS